LGSSHLLADSSIARDFAAAFGAVAGLMGAMCVIAMPLRGPLSRLASRARVML
jgi:hypothetical protein